MRKPAQPVPVPGALAPTSGQTAGEVVLLFPGQGAQRQGMAVDLYRRHEPFRVKMDTIFELWGREGEAIRADWLSQDPVVDIDDFRRSQPLLFAVDFALAEMVRAAGIEPVALLGHSVGEVVAAAVAGVVTLADAAAMLMERLVRLADAPSGGMLAVAASVAEAEPLLGEGVSLAAVNAPKQIMVAGPDEPLERARLRLEKASFITQQVRTTLPFHSQVLAPWAARCLPTLRSMRLSTPALPLYSGYTGGLLGREATEPGFWAAQPAGTVFFADALDAVARSGPYVFVEAGPWQLTALVRRHPSITRAGGRAVALLPRRVRPLNDAEHFAAALQEISETVPGSAGDGSCRDARHGNRPAQVEETGGGVQRASQSAR